MQNNELWEVPSKQEPIKRDGLQDPAYEAKAETPRRAGQGGR